MRLEDSYEPEKYVVHSPTGYFLSRSGIRRRFGRSTKRLADPPIMRAYIRKGINTEKRFKSFVETLIDGGRLPWATKVRKASRNQDFRLKIDYLIHCCVKIGDEIVEFRMQVQVKSSVRYADEFRDANPNCKVHIIVMSDKIRKPVMIIEDLNSFYREDVEALKENVL